jgi:tRNA (guanine37-N1)-methyltransferase
MPKAMRIDVLTIFPEFFTQVFDFGIIRRAKLAELVEINVHDIREFATDKHKMVDDRPFGGGDGMVMKPEPIFAAIENLLGTSERARVSACNLRGSAIAARNAAEADCREGAG